MTSPVQETPAQTTAPAEKTAQQSFAEVRKALEAERAEKAQMKQRLEELEKQSKQKKNYQVQEDEEESDEPYVDQRSLKKKFTKFEETIDQKIAKAAEEKARQIVEEQNRNNYLKQNADFDQTMQPEVIQKFAEKYPGIAEAILRMPDGFERQRLVYESIKGTGVNKKEESKIQDTINANRRSPFQPANNAAPPYSMQGDFSDAGQKNAYSKMKDLQKRLRIS